MFSQDVISPMAELPGVCILVSVVLIAAAVIDGWKLKVPNWITFPMVLGGWTFSTYMFGWEGLVASLIGTAVGLALLLPAYAIGGMGAGDVKLLAGVGALVGKGHLRRPRLALAVLPPGRLLAFTGDLSVLVCHRYCNLPKATLFRCLS